MEEGGVRGQGTIRVALAFAALLAALTSVVWRQSRALEELRVLDEVRSERAIREAERATLMASIQTLEGRARIRRVAETQLGMRVPTAEDLVTLRRRAESRVKPRPVNMAVAEVR
jgi:cell division protein FtsL